MIVGTPSTLTFSLVAPSGVTYSSPTVTVESNPWPTASMLTDNGDGTYSITITPDREIQAIIKLKVVQGDKTYYHALMTQASGPLNLLNPTPSANVVGNGNIALDFNLAGLDGVAKMWDLRQDEIIKAADIGLTANTTGVTIAFMSRSYSGTFNRCRITASQTWGSADQYKLTWTIKAKHPLSKVMHQFQTVTDHFKAPIFTWVSEGPVTSGIPVVLEFTAKFASGNPVRGLVLKPTTITGGTVDPDIVVIDEDAGRYGVRVTPGSVNFSINPQVAIGNSATMNSASRTFTAVAGATVTMSAMAGATRTIGIKLLGATAGDQITAVSGGAIMDPATGGPWTPTSNGVFFIPLTASNRNRPANTNTTPNTVDTINVTYTRGGNTVTVPCSITVVWANVKVSAFTLTSNLLQFSGTIAGADIKWTFSAANFLSETGAALATSGTVTNNITTDGKVYWNLNARLADQRYVSFTGAANNGFNSTYYYWTDPFDIARVPYMVMSTVEWDFSQDQTLTGKVADLPDLIRTFTDDKGVPLTGLSLNTVPTNWSNIFQPRLADGTDWSKVLVPVTDGSDGKYYVRASQTGQHFTNWWVTVFPATFVFNTNEYGPMTFTFNSRIN
ncbi:hypothetical protein CRX22_11170 [Salmonella enterica subsp. enterica serovar Newport]|nr:hypothetical protein [Salmonella enterica subsp. enterica serovar Newport]